MTQINFRWMSSDEIDKVKEIDRTERIRAGYEMRDGVLQLIEVNWDTTGWSFEGDSENTIAAQIDFCKNHLKKGAVIFGAFNGDQLVGIGLLTPDIRPKIDQLAFLHVSRVYRRQGIAHKIVSELAKLSGSRGSDHIYVSATPSGSAIGFYLDFGFVPVSEPLPELYEVEPEDIHMKKKLDLNANSA